MKKTLLRPAMIVGPLALGMLFPAAAGLSFLIRWLLIGMLFLVYLQLELRELKPCSGHWRILAANVGIGVAAYLGFRLAGNRELALAAFFIGITPTATAAPVIMNFLRGRVGFVVTGFIVTNVGVSLALLGLIPAVTGNFSASFIFDVFVNLLLIIVLPFVVAFAVRKAHPRAVEWPDRCKMLSLSMWSLVLFIVAAGASKFIRSNSGVSAWTVVEIAGIAAALCAVNFIVGGLVVPRQFRREGSQTLGQKNTMLTMYLALTFVNPLTALGPTFYVVCHNAWNAFQLFAFDREQARRGSSGGKR